MARQTAEVEIHAADSEESLVEGIAVSVDLIDDNLYLGNMACVHDSKTLEKLQITHVLTIDLVILSRSVMRGRKCFIVKLADQPKEDLLSHLALTNDFIKSAVASGGTMLVHCCFGVSRSAAVVIAYIMQKYGFCYEEAFNLVKSKRSSISPNVGFIEQLKLYGLMGNRVNMDDPRFKQFRLRIAFEKRKQLKGRYLLIDLVKPDPGLTRERPDPIVYRCKSCRRIVASQNNIIPHLPKDVKEELAKKALRPRYSKLPLPAWVENSDILIEKLQGLTCPAMEASSDTGSDPQHGDQGPSQLDGYHKDIIVDASIVGREEREVCRRMWFVEPMDWMNTREIFFRYDGKLYCPKCDTKIGNFNWDMGYECPCGQRVAPAFYLVPSKVWLFDIVQNVQTIV